jgi:hypothetical protein
MRNPWVRRVFLGLIFVFPLLIGLASSRSLRHPSRGISLGSPIVVVEGVVLCGVVFAGRERRRLLVALEEAGTRPDPTLAPPSPALAGSKGVVRQPVLRTRAR